MSAVAKNTTDAKRTAALKRVRHGVTGLVIAAAIVALPYRVAGESDRVRLTLSDATAIVAAAQRTAVAMNVRVSVAVVDPRGDVILLERMSGANATSADTTIGKAMVSAIYLRPSGTLAGRGGSPTNAALNEATGGRLRFIQGGVPIVRRGLLLGAVAAGGATSEQDEKIATDGAAVIP